MDWTPEVDSVVATLSRTGWVVVNGGRLVDDPTLVAGLRQLSSHLLRDLDKFELSVVSPTVYSDEAYLANTDLGMSLHTDNVYLGTPCELVLMCLANQPESGGHSLLIDSHEVVQVLTDELLQALARPVWQWSRADQPSMVPCEVIKRNGEIRWWRRGLVGLDSVMVKVADQFDRMLHEADGVTTLTLESGDILVVDNRRILHGRTPFVGAERRLIRVRAWGTPEWSRPALSHMP